MKIFILGTGKSGTTALLYKVAGGLPNCQAFSGGRPGKYVGNYENAVYKHTYDERKGKNFELYSEHLEKEHYDRKIWMARDPRDAAVSRMLYRWHRGYLSNRKQFKAHFDLVLKKEQDPASVSFMEICHYTGYHQWPRFSEDVIEEERVRNQNMTDFVNQLGDDWFLFRFEDMVAKNTGPFNDYLGFQIKEDTEVPVSTGKAKVVRKKASGDWRHWFTEEDVELFKPVYLPYMEAIGYDCDDWALSPKPVIEPQYSSMYMKQLLKRKPLDSIRWFKDTMLKRLAQKA
ncbi:MAG: sulfotransferase domain-containing protein [Desulfobacterales bacterium]|nr:MAG: sulfotransferase domain-containing protein [Desulfobacterales bacterium]